jgi:EAL domain-containing protein (putative c-di-GMP-specific phosphodiesterase class I)
MGEDGKEHPFYSLIASASQASPSNRMVGRALQAIRAHLGMEVAYVSEFVGDRTVFREVDAPGLENIVKVGDSYSLDDVYCRHILEGRLPQLIADTADEPVAMAMPITTATPIGKHMSVPIRLPDGSVYGMFCCVGFKADRSLHERDLQMMKVFADLAAFEISRDLEAVKVVKEKQERIKTVIEKRQISTVYQPIWRLENVRPIGFECLSRFSAAPPRSPDKWFAEAAEAGLGTSLELAAIRLGLSALESLSADIYVAVNVSPQTILSGDLPDALEGLPLEQIVLEITEHAHIDDYDRLLRVLYPLRSLGMRLAVDDAGAGYSSLQHILQIRPDLIKLDITLTRNINLDPARKALASALVVFARETGSRIIAEGVETASELSALRGIGIEMAQRYFLGRPMPFHDDVKLFGLNMPAANLVA